MTFRAVVIGLLGALFIAGLGYMNEVTIGLESFMAGQLVPMIVFGPLILAMMFVNLIMRRIKPGLGFKPAELAVTFVLILTACSVPSRGLLEPLMVIPTMPLRYYEQKPGWRKYELIEYAPPDMFVSDRQYDEETMSGFLSGWGSEGHPIGLKDVPWHAWREPLKTWLALAFLLAVAGACTALVVHRQWSSHERLRYPIAEFASALIEEGPGGSPAPIFSNKLFWLGLLIPLSIRVINGLYAWFPDVMINIPLRFDFAVVVQKWPIIGQAPHGWDLFFPRIFPIVIAFTFFLATDISLSLGISQAALVVIGLMLVSRGVDITGDPMTGGGVDWQRFGSYAGFGVMLLFIGRRYYWQVFKGAVTFVRTKGVDRHTPWAARALVLALAGMILFITRLGLDWPLAVLAVLLILLQFFVVARLSAETGVFYILPSWTAVGVLIGLFGDSAMGIKGIVIIGLISWMFCLNPCQSIMAYLVNGLRVCDRVGVKPGRVGLGAMGIYIASVAIAVPVALWFNYNGGLKGEEWMNKTAVPVAAFNAAEKTATKLTLSGELEKSDQLTPYQRLTSITPDRKFLWFAGTGLAAVLLVGTMRLRYSWWPFHPVIFLVWGTHPMKRMWASLLLGWALKSMVTKLGGYQAYRKCREFMIGVIAGELLGGITFMIVSVLYYKITGLTPVVYQVLF